MEKRKKILTKKKCKKVAFLNKFYKLIEKMYHKNIPLNYVKKTLLPKKKLKN